MDGEAAAKRGINKIENVSITSFDKNEREETMVNIRDEAILENSDMSIMQFNKKASSISINKDFELQMKKVDKEVKFINNVVRPKIDVVDSVNEITGSIAEELESLRI